MSVNRMVAHVDPAMFLHANCSVQMIRRKLPRHPLPVERRMARIRRTGFTTAE